MASTAMPGFVRLATSPDQPRGHSWELESFSGITSFRTVFSVPTSDCARVEAAFRAALGTEQIPHSDDLFNVPVRFARQILELESQAFPPEIPVRSSALIQPITWATAAVVSLFVGVLALSSLAQQHQRQQQRSSVAVQEVPATQVAALTQSAQRAEPFRPRFRRGGLELR